MRKTLKKLHLLLASLSGIVIFAVCITGCIYAFKTEIININSYTRVEYNPQIEKLNLSEIVDEYTRKSNRKIVKLYDFKDPEKALILKTREGFTNFTSYINPYTGEIIKETNGQFFTTILHIHRSLLLGNIGGKIVAWSVVIFIFCLLSGLYLWLPLKIKSFAKRKVLKAKFSVKIKSNWTRKIFDLHSVLGMYAFLFLFIISITGLVWSFKSVDNAIYQIVMMEKKGKRQYLRIKPAKLNNKTFDIVKKELLLRQNDSYTITKYSFPRSRRSPMRVLSITDEGRYGNSNTFYVHPSTGEILKERLFKDKNAGEKLRANNYDIHTGSIWGIWGKIIAFMASLIGALLPITGFIFFFKKRKKSHK